MDQRLLRRRPDAPVVAHGQPHEGGDVKILVMGRQGRQIQQIVVALVPGGVRHFRQQIARLPLPVAEVEVDRAEVEAQAAHVAEQQHPTVRLGTAAKGGHLVPHRLLETALAATQIVASAKGEQPRPLHAKPAPLAEPRQFVQIQPQHEEAVREGVAARREATVAHRALPDGADGVHGVAGGLHRLAPKRLATSRALRTPSS